MMRPLYAICIVLMISMTSFAADEGWQAVHDLAQSSTGASPSRDSVDPERMDELLVDGITRQEAVQIALMNNSALQAVFADLGVAQADLRQAGTYSNPAVETVIRWPEGEGSAELEVEAAWNIADLWRVPVRRNVAHARLRQMTMTVLHETLNTAADARIAWDSVRALEMAVAEAEQVLTAAEDLRDRIYERWEYGFGEELDRARMDSEVAQAETELEMARAERETAFARLGRVLGLPGEVEFTLAGDLVRGPAALPPGEELVRDALRNRPDLHAAEFGLDAAEQQLRLERRSTWRHVELGPAYTHEPDGEELWGVTLSVELPIGDDNSAQRDRARSEVRQAGARVGAIEAAVREQVLVALEELQFAMKREELIRERVLPARGRAHEFAQKHYMQMELSMLPVLQTRKELAATRLAQVEARREIASAHARLEFAVGGRLDTTSD